MKQIAVIKNENQTGIKESFGITASVLPVTAFVRYKLDTDNNIETMNNIPQSLNWFSSFILSSV